MAKVIGVRLLRATLRHVLEEVSRSGERYVIERQGEPLAALIPWDQYVMLYLDGENGELESQGIRKG